METMLDLCQIIYRESTGKSVPSEEYYFSPRGSEDDDLSYTGRSTRTRASQYRQNKIPFVNDIYLSLLSILPIGSDIFP
jgi:hypothetical protein